MKRRVLALVLVLIVLAAGSSTVLAGGARNGTTVFYEIQGRSPPHDWVYCEGYFTRTGNGIVHTWRDNAECVPYAPAIMSPSLHIVFKPAEKFDSPDCDDKATLYHSGLWTLNPTYRDVDLDNDADEANLTDFLGEPGVDFWQICIYEW
jgi:hypothetical protein